MELTLSKKQQSLLNDIISVNKKEIYVLGSTQSGKTYDICLGTILYAQELHKYDSENEYYGSITAWSLETLKGNIVEPLEHFLKKMGFTKSTAKTKGDYELRWQSEERYLQLWNVRFYFFGFNNQLAFNKILGKPLIFEWCDESARIYTQKQLQIPFDEFPGRQVSFAGHPYKKSIHSFNVEGSENHDYKKKYIDGKPNAIHYTFFPYDNPKLDTKEKIIEVVNSFPPGSLREQKIFNKWVVAEGRVFNELKVFNNLGNIRIREIGIGIDYGSVNPTTFVPIALCFKDDKWFLTRLECYYHNPKENGDTPTTEFYTKQLKLFIDYLHNKYKDIPITTLIIDSEASHFDNALEVANIRHNLSKKGPGSVDEGVQHLQSLIYKDYFYIYKQDSIKQILDNGEVIRSGKDESYIEFEGYQYDTIKAVKEGINCYKKEMDHSIDATRYLIDEWKATGRCPIV